MTFIHTKARARIKKVRARKVLIHGLDFQPLKIPSKSDKVISGNQAIGVLIALTILQRLRGTIQDTLLGSFSSSGTCPPSRARCFGSWLHAINWIKNGNQKVPENMRCIMV